MKLLPSIILTPLLLSILSCGGGGDSAPSVADFQITGDNQKTVRYLPNHSTTYSLKVTNKEDSSSAKGTYIESYSYSNSPSVFRDGEAETITKSEIITVDGQAFSRTLEVIQFPEDWNETPSASQRVYRLTEDGVTFNIGYDASDGSSYGALIFPDYLYTGYQYNQNYDKRRTDNGSIRNVVVNHSVSEIEIVQTDLGNFDAFKMEQVYTETSRTGSVDSIVGTFWVHPSIGVIKAKYVATESINSASTDVFEAEYVITSTNLSY